jgi:hypothetical protein
MCLSVVKSCGFSAEAAAYCRGDILAEEGFKIKKNSASKILTTLFSNSVGFVVSNNGIVYEYCNDCGK